MGSSESKMTVSSTIKPDSRRTIKHDRVGRLIDPRSPSTDIDRTPIQVGGPVSKTSVEVKTVCALPSFDPRSPTIGIARTPVRDAMRATVGSFARRLGMLFHSEVEDKAPAPPHGHLNLNVEEEVVVDEELGSGEPLLTSQPSQTFGSLAEHANLLSTPVLPRLQSMGDLSPFVHLEEARVEVETEADLTLEEAEEARESPLHKRLSMSLITCHEGAAPSQIFAEVHHDSTSSPVPSVEVEPLGDGTDHCYALPSINSDPECPMTPVQPSVPTVTDVALVPASSEQPEDAVQMPSSVETQELAVQDSPVPPVPTTLEPATVPSPVLRQERPQPSTGIRCPTFDSKSPSQVVFKPQWLGKGFGASGLRARGVQVRGGKGGSSPLAVRVAVKNITNENKGQSAKLKQKGNGLAEGRSPLQILKETNSPRDQNPQMKLKVSTPDRQRLGQVDRRVLTVALDKENR